MTGHRKRDLIFLDDIVRISNFSGLGQRSHSWIFVGYYSIGLWLQLFYLESLKN